MNMSHLLIFLDIQLDSLQSFDIRDPSIHTQQRSWVTDYLITCHNSVNSDDKLGIFVGSNELSSSSHRVTRFSRIDETPTSPQRRCRSTHKLQPLRSGRAVVPSQDMVKWTCRHRAVPVVGRRSKHLAHIAGSPIKVTVPSRIKSF